MGPGISMERLFSDLKVWVTGGWVRWLLGSRCQRRVGDRQHWMLVGTSGEERAQIEPFRIPQDCSQTGRGLSP